MTNSKKADFKNIQIRGIVDYARVHSPKTKYGKNGSTKLEDMEFTITLRLDNEKTKQELIKHFEATNVALIVPNPSTFTMDSRFKKDKNDGHEFVQFKRDAANRNGDPVSIDVVDSKGNPLSKNTLIGNGSEAIIHLFVYQGVKGGGVVRLSGIQVVDLKTPVNNKFKAVSGFVVGDESDDSTESEDNNFNNESHF